METIQFNPMSDLGLELYYGIWEGKKEQGLTQLNFCQWLDSEFNNLPF